ncbi:hypothetical protein KP509_09G016900 [Ceratopteris richardii]|uniref:HORMA domain-containing protein n=1 Tax=Ceratopteris richardii TaxID=49495 RepID=A0A8T2U298_CERRI|nr:hypothetical protein KP509_09G016900 [Ceratopteris richardii]KAH7428779.1 hypothetical protein KP509_09G016900 [Ceratopteris richardii]KAH7428780.1 hypothetical protein KP509_09G016900 [Ceratopteris richardii]
MEEITSLLAEFLEVAITLVLSVRGIYPPEVFERRRYLNVPVQWARHPELREYINSAVTSAMPWIQKRIVEKLAVVILDKSNMPLEKFTFQLQVHQEHSGNFTRTEIEYALRAFFLKLSVAQPYLEPLPPETSWEIVIFSKELPGDAEGKGHFWVPAEAKLWDQPPVITPIKSMSSKPLNVQLFIEHPSM